MTLPKAEEDEDDEDVDDGIDDDDDSRVDHSIQDSESDEHAFSDTNTEEDEEPSSNAEDDIKVDWELDGVGFLGVGGSVNSGLLRTPVETYSVLPGWI